MIESALTIAEGSTIEADDLTVEPWTAPSEGIGSSQFDEDNDPATVPDSPVFSFLRFKEWKEALLELHQREYFQQVLARAGGNVTKTAELAGVVRSHMQTMIQRCALTG